AGMVEELPQLRKMLHERGDDLRRGTDVLQGIGDDEGLETRQRVKRDVCDVLLVELFDRHTAHVCESDHRGTENRGVGDGEVNLELGRNVNLEGDTLPLGGHVADAMLDKVQALFLCQSLLEVMSTPDQASLALLAHTPLEHRFNENRSTPLDQCLDLLLRRLRAEHVRGRKPHVLEKVRTVQHPGELHRSSSSLNSGRSTPKNSLLVQDLAGERLVDALVDLRAQCAQIGLRS